jgi:hypothetical protein
VESIAAGMRFALLPPHMRTHRYVHIFALAIGIVVWSAQARAQDTASPSATPAPPAQIDETIINLPTTLPLKAHGSYFRVTHRFARDLTRGSFSDLAQDLFSLDSAAIIGLEYRFGITSTVQAGVHRSILDKTIQTFGRWDGWTQSDTHPVGLSALGSFEGWNNLHRDFQPGAAMTISRTQGTRLALYATPTYVHHAHTDTLLALHEGHNLPGVVLDTRRDTLFLGLAGRLRVLETVYVVLEGSPRLAGYDPDEAAWNVGIEKLTHGHVLQLNIGNNFDTTPGQLARGGVPGAVFLGFNISRKFY